METQLVFERHSFFDSPDQRKHLRYSERVPPYCEQKEHDICGCTRHVVERPAGTPQSISQSITLTGPVGSRWLDLQVTEGSIQLTFLWDDPSSGLPTHRSYAHERGKIVQANHHAYFWLQRDRDALQVEITHKGCGLVDHMSGHLYLGTERAPLGKMRNGWLPVELDLLMIKPDDVWAYACEWGCEAMTIMPDTAERTMWRELFAKVKRAAQEVQPILQDHAPPVQQLCDACRLTGLPYLFDWAAFNLQAVVDQLEASQLWRACQQVDQQVARMFKEKKEQQG